MQRVSVVSKNRQLATSSTAAETEDGSTVCVYRIRSGKETGRGRWRSDTRCCTQEESEGVMILHGVIVNVEISKEVVRVERWQGRTIAVWMMIRQQVVCVICVYRPQTGRTESEQEAFREEVESLAGMSDGQMMLCVAGDFNAHIGVVESGDEESIGILGFGTRNREGWELLDMLRKNGLAFAGTFFQKKESHQITYRSGRYKTELDLLVVRQQQLRRVNDCNVLAGEYVTIQHKPVVFEVRMKKRKDKRTMGPTNIKWWKCKDEMMVEYRERIRRKYDELDA